MKIPETPGGPVALASALILVPTWLEAEQLQPLPVSVAAFGLVDAGIAAMRLLEDRRPAVCVLAGIAGTLDPEQAPIGAVVEATGFRCFGIGAGAEPDLLLPEEMGLPAGCSGLLEAESWEEATSSVGGSALARGEFLSVTAASAHAGQARVRAARFPRALVEEMEGFAVARAARVLGVPFASLRAVSNLAGERDPSCWETRRALAALRRQLEALEELWS